MESNSEQQKIINKPNHPWKARCFVGAVMLIVAFLGVILTDVRQDGAWNYWRVSALVFAFLSIGLSLYLKKVHKKESAITIFHEALHWLGLIFAVLIVSIMVKNGSLGRLVASAQISLLLALTTFLAGVYIEKTFLFIGIALGFFTLGVSMFQEYLYPIVVFCVILTAIVTYFAMKRSKNEKMQ